VLKIVVEKVGVNKKLASVQKTLFREKSSKKIEKSQQTLKNTKYIHFFLNFKRIKQQQHQINTLAHKYGESNNKQK
jgi:hypothetical protein